MSNEQPDQVPPNPFEQQPPAQGPSTPPKVEVHAEPTRGTTDPGRVYDAPPFHREAPPNPPGSSQGSSHGGSAGGAYGGSQGGSSGPPREPSSSTSAAAGAPVVGWAVACHLIGLADFGVSILFAGLIFTAALWLLRRGDDPFADFHGAESLNLQLNLLFWQVVAVPLILCCLVGLPMLILSPFVKAGLLLYGAYRASRGDRWRYPYILRVVG